MIQDAEQFVRSIVKAVVDAAMHAGANLSTLDIQIAVGRVTLMLIAQCRRRDAAIRLGTIEEVRARMHDAWTDWSSEPVQLELPFAA
jgi:hypothetical protein